MESTEVRLCYSPRPPQAPAGSQVTDNTCLSDLFDDFGTDPGDVSTVEKELFMSEHGFVK